MWERTYGQLFLQAVVEVFGLVGLQLLEGDPHLADELVVAEFVLVTHRDPGGEEGWGRRRRVGFKTLILHLLPIRCCPSSDRLNPRQSPRSSTLNLLPLWRRSSGTIAAQQQQQQSPCGLPEEGIAEFWPW